MAITEVVGRGPSGLVYLCFPGYSFIYWLSGDIIFHRSRLDQTELFLPNNYG